MPVFSVPQARIFRRICDTCPRGRRAAFTLAELLTVIAIIGVLATVLLPLLGGARKSADVATCAARLRQLYHADMMHAAEHDGALIRSFRLIALKEHPENYPGIDRNGDLNLHWWQNMIAHGYLGAPDIPNPYYVPARVNRWPWNNSELLRRYYTVLGCPTVQDYGLESQTQVDAASGIRLPEGSGMMNYCMNVEISNPNSDIACAAMPLDRIAQPSRAIFAGDYKLDRAATGGIVLLHSQNYFPEGVHDGKVNIAFYDGHVALLDPETQIPKRSGDRRAYFLCWRGEYTD